MQKENRWKGYYANDAKNGGGLVWSRANNIPLDNSKELNVEKVISMIFRRVFTIRSENELDEIKDRLENKDLLALTSNQDEMHTIDFIKKLDRSLPEDIPIVYFYDPKLLERRYGVAQDNPLSTVRFLRLANEQESPDYTYYSLYKDAGVWAQVAWDLTKEKLQHFESNEVLPALCCFVGRKCDTASDWRGEE